LRETVSNTDSFDICNSALFSADTEVEEKIPEWSARAWSTFLHPLKNIMPSSYYGAEI